MSHVYLDVSHEFFFKFHMCFFLGFTLFFYFKCFFEVSGLFAMFFGSVNIFNSHVKEEVKMKYQYGICQYVFAPLIDGFMSVIHCRVYQGEMAGHLDLQGLPDLQDRSSTSQQATWVER